MHTKSGFSDSQNMNKTTNIIIYWFKDSGVLVFILKKYLDGLILVFPCSLKI